MAEAKALPLERPHGFATAEKAADVGGEKYKVQTVERLPIIPKLTFPKFSPVGDGHRTKISKQGQEQKAGVFEKVILPFALIFLVGLAALYIALVTAMLWAVLLPIALVLFFLAVSKKLRK